MSEGWQRCHRRYELTQAVLADVAHSGSPALTTARSAQVEAEYGNLAGFLKELQYRWYRLLTARLDALLEADQGAVEQGAVRRLWRELTIEQRAMWRLLRAYRDDPELAAGEAKHRAQLRAAGVAEVGFTTEPSTDEPHRPASAESTSQPTSDTTMRRTISRFCPARLATSLVQSRR